MKVDFFLIEQDRKTSIYHDEFKLGRILVMPKITLQMIAQRTKRKIATDVRSYNSAVHVSADGKRYAVAFSGDIIPPLETDELIRTSDPKPLPLI
ncbi:hypothetical protein [Acerihabitans arboris]|uniref:Uncharacterized protein n=1 Tax=Acerihabitans arboris TaxID=2691583 RepID=A0A845SHN6_9GAMM|nr:hypothetical protein [Acerihabitans arboris]NDL64663.1 hypothetical protein [Acerihabitans arboris]